MCENIFRCNEVSLMVSMTMTTTSSPLFLLLKSLLTTYLIVNASLIRIRKTSHSCIYFLEGISCFRSWVFIRVHFNGAFLESFFQIVLIACFFNTQHCVVVLATNYFIAYFHILLRVRSLIFLWLLFLGFLLGLILGLEWLLFLIGGFFTQVIKSLKENLCFWCLLEFD